MSKSSTIIYLFFGYTQDELAKEILDLPEGAQVTVKATCGIYKEVTFTSKDWPVVERKSNSGLLVSEIIEVKPQPDPAEKLIREKISLLQ
ncbi:MAG: hypothetical protein CSA20_08705 [Deltaproteobacteria bacterium]|nr:MAG: hypothetical protein CSA20_08705 [Deltaproteobacteria bacterium]